MKIKTKFVGGGLLLALVPLVLSNTFTSFKASSMAEEGLINASEELLISQRQSMAKDVTEYFEFIEGVLLTQAASPTIASAMIEFKKAFTQIPAVTDAMKTDVKQYYNSQFGAKFASKNPDSSAPVSQMTSSLDDQSWYWQYKFITDNPAALGSKDEMINPNDNSEYAQLHSRLHPYIRKVLQRFELYDIFLVDPDTGDIVYTCFKELDFSTSLKTGPYAQTGLGKAFASAMAIDQPGQAALTAFEPYLPSYNDPASFISTPIFENGQKVGILIFQMPLGHINSMMTKGSQWKEFGLGETGEALFLNGDGTLLNETRLMKEYPQEALKAYADAGSVNKASLNRIRSNNSTVGSDMYKDLVQNIDAPLVQNNVMNPAGIEVIRTVTPFSVMGQEWFVLTEMAESESTAVAVQLKSGLISFSLILMGMVAAIVFVGVRFFANASLSPLAKLSLRSEELASSHGADLTQKLQTDSGDEIAEASSSLNRFFERIRRVVSEVSDASKESESATAHLERLSTEAMNDVADQTERTSFVAAATTEMSTSIHDIAQSVEQAAENVRRCDDLSLKTQNGFQQSIIRLQALDQEINNSTSVVNQLEDKTDDIGRVLDVIRDIADQTNLLALNAAIEAARAGDQGRGFAVVADEVRKLASRTRESTTEVDTIIAELQAESAKAVKRMAASSQLAKETIDAFKGADTLILDLKHNISSISDELGQVATAAEEQNAVASDIAMNLEILNNISETVNSKFQDMNSAVHQLNVKSKEMQSTVGVFKV